MKAGKPWIFGRMQLRSPCAFWVAGKGKRRCRFLTLGKGLCPALPSGSAGQLSSVSSPAGAQGDTQRAGGERPSSSAKEKVFLPGCGE